MNNSLSGETKSRASSGIKWWKTGEQSGDQTPLPVAGAPCPKCYLGDLELDSLFRLQCSNCGFVAVCGAFT